MSIRFRVCRGCLSSSEVAVLHNLFDINDANALNLLAFSGVNVFIDKGVNHAVICSKCLSIIAPALNLLRNLRNNEESYFNRLRNYGEQEEPSEITHDYQENNEASNEDGSDDDSYEVSRNSSKEEDETESLNEIQRSTRDSNMTDYLEEADSDALLQELSRAQNTNQAEEYFYNHHNKNIKPTETFLESMNQLHEEEPAGSTSQYVSGTMQSFDLYSKLNSRFFEDETATNPQIQNQKPFYRGSQDHQELEPSCSSTAINRALKRTVESSTQTAVPRNRRVSLDFSFSMQEGVDSGFNESKRSKDAREENYVKKLQRNLKKAQGEKIRKFEENARKFRINAQKLQKFEGTVIEISDDEPDQKQSSSLNISGIVQFESSSDEDAEISQISEKTLNRAFLNVTEEPIDLDSDEGVQSPWQIGQQQDDQPQPNTVRMTSPRFECFICSKKFKYKSNLRFHIKTFHLKTLRYSCEICNRKFKKSYQLKTHKYQHHTNYRRISSHPRYKCHCGASFARLSSLKCHQRIHMEMEKSLSFRRKTH